MAVVQSFRSKAIMTFTEYLELTEAEVKQLKTWKAPSVEDDVARNHKRLAKAKASDKTFTPLKSYLSARPPRG